MKCQVPQISWHGRDPVLSIDFLPIQGDQYKLASGGTDSHVLIWYITYQENKSVKLECACDLSRHSKSVNVVRFSPNGEFLASGDDEGAMFIWQLKERELTEAPKEPKNDEHVNKEEWYTVKLLRGHLEDIYDISWSKDGNFLVSASMDNSAIMWDMIKYVKLHMFSDFKGYVQGVSWDPCNQFIASLGSDRTLRIHNINSKKAVGRVSKAPWSNCADKPNLKAKLFYDDTLKSYCRRLTFTPDGELLIVPSGIIDKGEKLQNACYIFSRHSPSKPVISLPTGDWYTIAVRCNPHMYKLRRTDPEVTDKENLSPKTMINLPYRMIFSVAACDSILLYDTEQLLPFACISNIHYAHLTDLAWSPDGLTLVASSTDGYCSFIVFTKEELGEIYVCEEPNENEAEKMSEILKTEKMELSSDIVMPETPKDTTPLTPKVTGASVVKDASAQNATDCNVTPSSKIVNILDKKSDKKLPIMNSIKKFFVSPKTVVGTSSSVKARDSIVDSSKDVKSSTSETEVIDLSDSPIKDNKPDTAASLEISKCSFSATDKVEPMDVDENMPVKIQMEDVKISAVEKQTKCKVRLDFTEAETIKETAKKSPKTSIRKFFMSPKAVIATKNVVESCETVTNNCVKDVKHFPASEKLGSCHEVTEISVIKQEKSEQLLSPAVANNPLDTEGKLQEISLTFGRTAASSISKSDANLSISSKLEPVIAMEENASDGDNTSTSIGDIKSIHNANDWKLELSQDEDIMEVAASATLAQTPEVNKSSDSKTTPKRRIALVTLSSKTTVKK